MLLQVLSGTGATSEDGKEEGWWWFLSLSLYSGQAVGLHGSFGSREMTCASRRLLASGVRNSELLTLLQFSVLQWRICLCTLEICNFRICKVSISQCFVFSSVVWSFFARLGCAFLLKITMLTDFTQSTSSLLQGYFCVCVFPSVVSPAKHRSSGLDYPQQVVFNETRPRHGPSGEWETQMHQHYIFI